MTYFLYHIPGKKIGVTCDLNNRVTKQQGYEPGEYEILETSEDIDHISSLELELQREYGYRVDMVPYRNLKPNNKMKINVTEQTTTFPVPVDKLKGRLMDNIGMSWQTEHGELNITSKTVPWIMKNIKTSMYNKDRSYVYNKAFARFYDNNDVYDQYDGKTKTGALSPTGVQKTPGRTYQDSLIRKSDPYSPDRKYAHQQEYQSHDPEDYDMPECCNYDDHCTTPKGSKHDCVNSGGFNEFDLIRMWANQRGIFEHGDTKTQSLKLVEEVGEICRAVLKGDHDEVVDGIGDAVVVLTNLAELQGVSIEKCINVAYNTISQRSGKMVNGTFVKDAD